MKTKAFKWASSIAVALAVVLAVMVVSVTVLAAGVEIQSMKLFDVNGSYEIEGDVQMISESSSGDYCEVLKTAAYGADAASLLTKGGIIEPDDGELSIIEDYVFLTGFWEFTADDLTLLDSLEESDLPLDIEMMSPLGALIYDAVGDSVSMYFLYTDAEGSFYAGNSYDALVDSDGTINILTDSIWKADYPAALLIAKDAYVQITGSTTYSVTYNSNGGDNTNLPEDNTVYFYGENTTVLSGDGLTYSGYTFKGWNTASNGSGDSYAAGDTIEITQNYTLYAQWEKEEECILGVSTDADGTAMSVPGEVTTLSKGDGVIYVKVSSEYLDKYKTTAYPTTDMTYGASGKYIFAGWYSSVDTEDDTNSVAMTAVPTSSDEYAYAKFVDANVLSVKAQITAGTTSGSKETDMRFVSTVDSTNYQEVGFLITINGKTLKKSSTKVYKNIVVSSEDRTVLYSKPSEFSSVSTYFFTYAVLSIPQDNFNTGITVQPYWITLDGTTVYGDEVIKTVEMGF